MTPTDLISARLFRDVPQSKRQHHSLWAYLMVVPLSHPSDCQKGGPLRQPAAMTSSRDSTKALEGLAVQPRDKFSLDTGASQRQSDASMGMQKVGRSDETA